jgi:hypothetical protein
VRLRKQPKAASPPGDAFLRAVSSGRAEPRAKAPAPVHTDDDALRERVLDSERRAKAAEDALAQIRDEGARRLEDARRALSAEREARLRAEEALARSQRRAQAAPADQEQPAPAPAADDDPAAGGGGGVGDPEGPRMRDPVIGASGDPEGEWPTPWLEGR